jgi:hypothetical protein
MKSATIYPLKALADSNFNSNSDKAKNPFANPSIQNWHRQHVFNYIKF